jgi:pimeloyl-ACP methyl ester carboxylesterase
VTGHGASDYVVVLHGLAGTKERMEPLVRALTAHGYCVVNLGYRSTRCTVQEVADRVLRPALEALAEQPGRVHLVTHSLGGLVVRWCLGDLDVPNLGRVVMLSPPNQGCRLLTVVRALPLGRPILAAALGPVSAQLGTTGSDLAPNLPAVGFELGVVAATGGWSPLTTWLAGGPHDGKLGVEETKVRGMKDFAVHRRGHADVMACPAVAEDVVCFLAHGRFRREAEARP